MITGTLIIISSPSGGGKGTLIKEILARVPNVGYSVSFTTRAIREGEADGQDYNFVSKEEFKRRIDAGEFLEFAEVHGNYYGTSAAQVEIETAAGRDVILEIDVQGAAQIIERFPEALSIFILPPSYEVLSERLAARGTETTETLELRLSNAIGEVRHFNRFQYALINDDKDIATGELETIILAERLKSNRQKARVQDILDSFDASKIRNRGVS